MQTFLPYADFYKSAQVLDYRRLGKQRIEVWQILMALLGETKAYRNHPITKAWEGYEASLCEYGIVMCQEWRSRGYRDTTGLKISAVHSRLFYESHKSVLFNSILGQNVVRRPHWLGREFVHESYKRLLVWKKPEHYGVVLGWQVEPLEDGKLDYEKMFSV